MEKEERDRLLREAMDTYGHYLLRMVYALVRDEKKAEDIVQDVFINYYINLDKFEARSSLKTYLYRIAVNQCHNYFNSWAFRKIELSNLFGKSLINHETPEDVMIQNESKENLADMIVKVPLKYRDVLWLHYYGEFSVAEIGTILNCPINTVKTRLARGRKLARIAYEEENYHEFENET